MIKTHMKKSIFLIYWILGGILLSCSSVKEHKTDNVQYFSSISDSIAKEKESIDKTVEIKNSELKVELIDFCNSYVACGTMAYGSVSSVKILEGKYQNDTILVAELCSKINYTQKKMYKLKYTPPPNFAVNLCLGSMYSINYNLKAENKYFLTFGSLTEVLNTDKPY